MNNIKETLKEIKKMQVIKGSRSRFIGALTEEMLKDFANEIKDGKFLPDIHLCRQDENYKSFWLPVLFLLFNKDEISNWFKDCLYLLHKDRCRNSWIIPNSSEFYSKILGISSLKKNLGISVNLDLTFLADIFNDFKVKYAYPEYLTDLFINAIRNRKTLTKIIEENSNIFKSGKSYTFHKLIEFCVIPVIGFEEIKNYFTDMVNIFKKEAQTDLQQPLTLDSFSYFLTGKRNSLSFNKIRKQDPEPVEFLKSLYTALLPELLKKPFPSKQQVFEYLKLNEEQIWEYQAYYQENLINYTHYNSGYFNNFYLNSLSKDQVAKFKSVISRAIDYFCLKRQIPKVREIFSLVVKQLEADPFLETIYQNRNLFNSLIVESCDELKEYFYKTRIESLDFKADYWQVFFKTGGKLHYRNFDFTLLKSNELKEELKTAIKFKAQHNENLKTLAGLIEKVSLIEKKFKVCSFKEIDATMLSTVYHYLETERNLSISTIMSFNTELKKVFQILREVKEEYSEVKSPPEEIKFFNRKNHSAKTEVIPEKVLTEISRFTYELPDPIRLAFKLFMQTGWRFGEIKNLRIEDFNPSSEFTNLTEITINITKTKEQRKSNGFSEFHSGFITNDLFNEILDYWNKTQPVRLKYDFDWLLFSLDDGKCLKLNSPRFNIYINDLIQRHHICGPDNKLWHFSSRQTRKTVVTSLIKDGASRSIVQKVCGHLRSETTEKYYIEVQKEKLASVNLEFYKSAIESHLKVDALDCGSQNLTQYYQQLSFSLELEYGICLKPVSEKLCPHLSISGCSNCHNLCTGRIYLKDWMTLLESSERLLNSLIEIYQKNGITKTEYRKYDEFKQLMNRYQRIKQMVEELNEAE